MEEKNKLSDDVRPEPKQGSGSLLAAARKQQNRSVEEIADELNLSVTQIRTIELDQSEGLPEPTYVRGYIRSYARLLDLDQDKVLDHYLNPNWQKGSRLDEIPRGIGSAEESDSGGFFTPGKVVTSIVLLGVVGFLWFSGKLDGLFGEQATEVATSSIQTQSDPGQTSSESNDANQTPELSTESTETSTAQQAPDDAAAPVAESPVPPVASEHRLVLSFTDTSWVDIRDAEGQRLAYKSYAQGESLDVSSASKMSVFIGNAKAVTAQYNDSEFDISQYREGVFARFSVLLNG